MRKTAQRLLTEYGLAAVVVYFAIFFAVLFGAWAAIGAGWKPTGALANVGAFTAAYLFTKVTQPVRIAATVVLAPLAAKLWERITGRRPGAIAAAPTTDEPRA
ncbi:hypothetical protein [Roseisolibacter agri]|uniref:DUF1279 domain-containing protein n=1 Tax=Roseisolibacter agri TaxID=2014610 RepID=A0AA37Q4H4_9BACT|nr:hypothetical protein [Roseisolibacter agri]GLC24457.1 hypothetical protein rosag_09700 [Roseisolibacter agri]